MNYKSFNIGDWIGHISGVIEDESELDGNEMRDLVEFLSILKQKSCADAISRQAVDELSKELVHTTRDKADFLCNFWEGLQKLPLVTPKEKTAAWVPTDEEPHEIYECNACGWLLYDEDRTDFKYCPNCGARMVSECR